MITFKGAQVIKRRLQYYFYKVLSYNTYLDKISCLDKALKFYKLNQYYFNKNSA